MVFRVRGEVGIRVSNKVGTIMIFRVRAKGGIRVSNKVGCQGGN